MIIASIMVPPPVLIMPLFHQMLRFNLVDTYWAIILPQVIRPAMVFILKKFFDQIPRELEEAARDGRRQPAADLHSDHPAAVPAHPGRRRDLRVHRRVEQLPVAVHRHQRRAT